MGKRRAILIATLTILVLLGLSTPQPIPFDQDDLNWYFNNLTPEQRLHIRKAIDYAIPRDQIIEEVLHGLGVKIASPVEANDGAYDPTIQPREYNLSKALDHLEDAFGYRYNESSEKYFSIVIMCPTSRDDRMEWAALTTNALKSIGIDTTLKLADWNIAVPRVFDRPTDGTQGFNYAHGGYDSLFIGISGSTESDIRQWFGKENWVPDGINFGYIANDEVNGILEQAYEDPILENRVNAFKEFQVWFKNNLPYFIIHQPIYQWAKDPMLKGVTFGFGYPNYGNWSHPTDTVARVMSSNIVYSLNPLFSSVSTNTVITGDIFERLIGRVDDETKEYYGQIAESWIVSSDQLTWTFNIRDGLKWSDGTVLTIDDVIFTYQSYLDPTIACLGASDLARYLNTSNIIKINDSSVQFLLNKFYAYPESHFTLPILQKAQMEDIPSPQWRPSFPTDIGYAPIGSGPYMMDKANTDLTEGSVILVTNPHYTNIRGHKDWNNPNRIPSIEVKQEMSTSTALSQLESGFLSVIDSQVDLRPYVDEITNSSWGEIKQVLSPSLQGFHINQISPIWGMNPIDPNVLYPTCTCGENNVDSSFSVFVILIPISYIIIDRKRRRR